MLKGWFHVPVAGGPNPSCAGILWVFPWTRQRCALRTLFLDDVTGWHYSWWPSFFRGSEVKGCGVFFCWCWCNFIVFLFVRCRCFGEINGICYPTILLVWIICCFAMKHLFDMVCPWNCEFFHLYDCSSKGTVHFPCLLAQMDSQWGTVEGLLPAKSVDDRCICICTIHCMCLTFYGI